jgi:hypothetical protein
MLKLLGLEKQQKTDLNQVSIRQAFLKRIFHIYLMKHSEFNPFNQKVCSLYQSKLSKINRY